MERSSRTGEAHPITPPNLLVYFWVPGDRTPFQIRRAYLALLITQEKVKREMGLMLKEEDRRRQEPVASVRTVLPALRGRRGRKEFPDTLEMTEFLEGLVAALVLLVTAAASTPKDVLHALLDHLEPRDTEAQRLGMEILVLIVI